MDLTKTWGVYYRMMKPYIGKLAIATREDPPPHLLGKVLSVESSEVVFLAISWKRSENESEIVYSAWGIQPSNPEWEGTPLNNEPRKKYYKYWLIWSFQFRSLLSEHTAKSHQTCLQGTWTWWKTPERLIDLCFLFRSLLGEHTAKSRQTCLRERREGWLWVSVQFKVKIFDGWLTLPAYVSD